MSWKNEVKSVINSICSVGDFFSLNDIYRFCNHFKELYPNNNYIEDKIRQTLQYLRDDGFIDFIENNGQYKRLK